MYLSCFQAGAKHNRPCLFCLLIKNKQLAFRSYAFLRGVRLVVSLSPILYFSLIERADDIGCHSYPPIAWLRFSDGLVVKANQT